MKHIASVHVAQSLHTELRSCSCASLTLHEREALLKAVAKRIEGIRTSLEALDEDGLEPTVAGTIERLLADAAGHARAEKGDFVCEIVDLPAEYEQLEQALQRKPDKRGRRISV